MTRNFNITRRLAVLSFSATQNMGRVALGYSSQRPDLRMLRRMDRAS
jgi:hypothetical protein